MVVQSRPPSRPAIVQGPAIFNAPAIYPRVQAVYSPFWGIFMGLYALMSLCILMDACGVARNATPKPAT